MWGILFIISISQGLFLLLLLLLGEKLKTTPGRFLGILLIIFLITNFDYYLIAGKFYTSFPYIFGVSNGLILLMGPALYFYAKSLLHNTVLNVKMVWHVVPYLIFFVISAPIFLLPFAMKVKFIDLFISGQLYLRGVDYIIFIFQICHLGLYLYATISILLMKRKNQELKASIQESARWISMLIVLLACYMILVFGLTIQVFASHRFSLSANYSYSLGCSLLLYFIAGFTLLNPRISFGEVLKRYKKPLQNSDTTKYLQRLMYFIEEEKVFLKPEIKLHEVAEMAGLTAHQLSQLINDKFEKNFSDFINHYRIEEFKTRLNGPEGQRYTLVGLAMEVGFNSKTSFNNTFKKFTGLTPSEFKKTNADKPNQVRFS